MKHFILGGARSGKSNFAEGCAKSIASNQNKTLIYIATAEALDDEMTERIQHHQRSRKNAIATANWTTLEEPVHLSHCLSLHNTPSYCVVIDCLTLWLSNCLHKQCWPEERAALISSLSSLQCDLFMVSNEVGLGITPLGQLSREFVDQSGWLHQELAKLCDEVTLVTAGLPLKLK